jgi:hypothetical protein
MAIWRREDENCAPQFPAFGGSPDDAARLLGDEIEKRTKVVAHTGLKQQ